MDRRRWGWTNLFNAVTGDPIAKASTAGLDFASVLNYARTKGNPALRKMSFHERGLMLRALLSISENSCLNCIALVTKPALPKQIAGLILKGASVIYLPMLLYAENFRYTLLPDGEHHPLGKANTFMGHHLLIPKEGVAIHINAFNFPVWGMLEKIAVNL